MEHQEQPTSGTTQSQVQEQGILRNQIQDQSTNYEADLESAAPEPYHGHVYTPPDESDEYDEDEMTLRSSVDRPAQALNLNGVSASRFFFAKPWLTTIVFENNTSEARDLDANERNYLSMLRLTLYLGLAGVVVLFNTRLPMHSDEGQNDDSSVPSSEKVALSRNVRLPLGIVFCVLSIIGLCATFNNYIQTITGYAKQRSIVLTTPLAQFLVFASGAAIFAANVVFLVYN